MLINTLNGDMIPFLHCCRVTIQATLITQLVVALQGKLPFCIPLLAYCLASDSHISYALAGYHPPCHISLSACIVASQSSAERTSWCSQGHCSPAQPNAMPICLPGCPVLPPEISSAPDSGSM